MKHRPLLRVLAAARAWSNPPAVATRDLPTRHGRSETPFALGPPHLTA